ncbi:hypothetical protein BH10PAT3_BH10PAT3_4960 [soil metagenome]
MTETAIIRGITPVDPEQHIALADYRRRTSDGQGVHVIEMANGVAAHLNNRILVFGRWITYNEHSQRLAAYIENPAQYSTDHLSSLSE